MCYNLIGDVMFERVSLLLNDEDLNKFRNSNVLLVGLGGVGGACFEALVRMGLNNITIIDNDSFEESNLNRQLLATRNNLGNSKCLEAQIRGKSINPSISINIMELFLDKSNIDEINYNNYDYIIDCCDTITTKYLLIEKALENDIKIITCLGTGNRFDSSKLEITNIWKTSYDPVAKVLRKMLRDNGISKKVMVLYSSEKPAKIQSRTPGSLVFVPNVAGFYIANYVFNDIIDGRK